MTKNFTTATSLDPRDLLEIARRLERWFQANQRNLPWREHYRPYHIWISEVMLQQTRMEVVLEYFGRFVQAFPDVSSLASSPLERVLAVWSGLGYYKRARMLHEGATVVMQRFGGSIPSDLDRLRTIPGIGRYTAGAIASIGFGLPAPIVEGNVTRVLARLDQLAAPVGTAELNRTLWRMADELVGRADSPRAFNQSMMELGALICRPVAPRCPECPVASLCRSRAEGSAERYPVGGVRRAVRRLEIPLFAVRDREGRFLLKREDGTLMRGMVHLPHGNHDLLSGSEPGRFRPIRFVGKFLHTVTNRRIAFSVYLAESIDQVRESGGEFLWIHPDELSMYPHPSYVRKAIGLVENQS